MKNSGVEWIGEIPEHWELAQLKHMANGITDGAHISPDTNSEDEHFISVVDIKNGQIDFDNSLKTSIDSYEYMVKTGCKPNYKDILLSKDGTVGKSVVVNTEKNFVVASSLVIISPKLEKVVPEYFNLLIMSNIIQNQIFSFMKGSALKRISIVNIKRLLGVFPPLKEQNEIINQIQSNLNYFDNLSNLLSKQIHLLKEYHQSLIYEAVTGKIDVREMVSEAEQEEVSLS
nr:restriction endonuclease subunit S [Halalkalibacter alkaliphilus]